MLAKSAGKHSEFFLASWSAFQAGFFFWTIFRATPSIFLLLLLNFVQGVFITQYKLLGGEKVGDNFFCLKKWVLEALEAQQFFLRTFKKAHKISLYFCENLIFQNFFFYVIFFISFFTYEKSQLSTIFWFFFKEAKLFFFQRKFSKYTRIVFLFTLFSCLFT